jgi:hypothetical protein
VRQRVRPAWSADELSRIYATPHDHKAWGRGHSERVDATIDLARSIPASSMADLSCGNAAIARALDIPAKHLGDFAPGYEHRGPIDETIHQIPEVDLFVCCETVEHLDDPDVTLALIAGKARNLVLSTPTDAWDDGTPEHYWAWDREEVESMLDRAGFTVVSFTSVDSRPYGEPYLYGIWHAERRAT